MNKETLKLFEYMVNNPKWILRLKQNRKKTHNYKDFYIESIDVIKELLDNEEEFSDCPRKLLQTKKIIDMYF